MELSLGILIKFICEELHRQGNEKLKNWDLTFPQMIILLELESAESKCCFLKDLEKRLRVSQPTVVGIVSRLIKKGYAEAMPASTDKRAKRIRLTLEGQQQCDLCKGIVAQSGANLVKGFSQEELEQLTHLLRKLALNLENKIY